MTDIVARLREASGENCYLCRQAADEIDRLRNTLKERDTLIHSQVVGSQRQRNEIERLQAEVGHE